MQTLKLEQLDKSFGPKKVLNDISFSFEQGRIYGLLGRNGAGKTTLFNCLAEEMSPDKGDFFLQKDGVVHKMTNEDVGYVYSTPILPEFLTGYEFVRFFMDIHADHVDRSKTIEEYLEWIGFEMEDAHRLIKGYSHGMKNKLQMLCVLIARPPVILLDEPLTSLDVVVALQIKKLLRSIAHDHIIIFSTHILQLAADLCDDIVVLSGGQLEMIDRTALEKGDLEAQIVALLEDKDDATDH